MSVSTNFLKVGTGIVIIYSIIIVASTIPAFEGISNTIKIIYFLLIPGYVLSLYLGEDYALLERVMLAVALGLMIVLVIYSFNNNEQITSAPLPYDLVIPTFSVVLVVFDYYRRRMRTI